MGPIEELISPSLRQDTPQEGIFMGFDVVTEFTTSSLMSQLDKPSHLLARGVLTLCIGSLPQSFCTRADADFIIMWRLNGLSEK